METLHDYRQTTEFKTSREKFVIELVAWIGRFGRDEARRMFYMYMNEQDAKGHFFPQDPDGLLRSDMTEAWEEADSRARH